MKKRKCDKCEQDATFHDITIVKGQKIEKHLCPAHAAEEGLASKTAHAPIHELLTNLVKIHSGAATQDLECPDCGLTFSKFREASLLGCPRCYEAFEAALAPLLERTHEGATHHIGKVPRRAGADDRRQAELLRMRKRLSAAVAEENYELAARLRDELSRLEGSPR